jgi:hypothetical protein
MLNKKIALAVAMSLGVLTTPASLADIVVNGSFEEPKTKGWKIYKSIPGWNTSAGAGIEIQHRVAGAPQNGNQLVELDSRNNTAIYQNITTEPGKAYRLTFYFSPRPRTKAGDNKLRVSWGGRVVANLDAGAGGSKTAWKKYSYAVGACQKATRLEFKDMGISNSLGTYIDNVSVELIK